MKFPGVRAIIVCSFFCQAQAQTNLLDPGFDPGTGVGSGFVETVLAQPDGKVLVCGIFPSFNGHSQGYLARLNSDGSVDTNFVGKPSYWVRHMILQPDGKIIIGGYFSSVNDISRKCIARLNADGNVDTSFDPGTGVTGTLGVAINGIPDPFVFQVGLQADGKILITGNFTNYNGTSINGIARLNTNGMFDSTFQVGSGLNSWGRSIQALPNNQILVTGWFDNYRNSSHERMALINPDGSPDNSFLPRFGDRTAVYTALKLSNGQFIAAGHSLNTNGLFKEEIRRLNADGSVDSSFKTFANEKIQSICLQPDGDILLGGEFNAINGVARKSIARIHADGSLDTSFVVNVDNWGWTVALQEDGRILFCGGFTTVNGTSRNGVARLLPNHVPHAFNPRRVGNAFYISVGTIIGKTYVLQYKNSVSDEDWISLSPVIGDGTVKTLSDPGASESKRFYRVVMN